MTGVTGLSLQNISRWNGDQGTSSDVDTLGFWGSVSFLSRSILSRNLFFGFSVYDANGVALRT